MTKKKKNKIVAFSIADENNLKYFEMMKNSLRKFHSKKDLPLVLIGPEKLKTIQDPHFFYRATPVIARDLMRQYDIVVKLDADQVITGDLSHTWEKGFDVGLVNNSNPKELNKLQVSVWNVHPLSYVNCGYVVMKSKRFVNHWFNLCASPHFDFYQYKEQDLLNIMAFYMDFNIRFLDASDMWHGLISKGYWPKIELKGDDLVLPKDGIWPKNEDKVIKIIHWAGGRAPRKMNFKIHFKPEVVKRLEVLTK